jgi:hypothetical protein
LLSRVNTAGRILAWGVGATVGGLAGGAVAGAYGVRWAIGTAAGFAVLATAIGWLSPLRHERLAAASPPGGRMARPGDPAPVRHLALDGREC